MAKTLNIQHKADRKITAYDDISAYLTMINNQMAEIAMTEGRKLLGALVKLTFKLEHLQF